MCLGSRQAATTNGQAGKRRRMAAGQLSCCSPLWFWFILAQFVQSSLFTSCQLFSQQLPAECLIFYYRYHYGTLLSFFVFMLPTCMLLAMPQCNLYVLACLKPYLLFSTLKIYNLHSYIWYHVALVSACCLPLLIIYFRCALRFWNSVMHFWYPVVTRPKYNSFHRKKRNPPQQRWITVATTISQLLKKMTTPSLD